MTDTVLVVEDEQDIADLISVHMQELSLKVEHSLTGEKALQLALNNNYALIILDVMLPGMSGLDVCRQLREKKPEQAILMLTSRTSEIDRVVGLELGADDYMTKPFNLEELLLRVAKLIEKNLQIHSNGKVVNEIIFGPNRIDFQAQECVDQKGELHTLTKKELMLLKLLVESENDVVTRERILKTVWGYNVYPSTRTIDNFVLTFRKYFEKDSRNPEYFHSIRGVGYKFTGS